VNREGVNIGGNFRIVRSSMCYAISLYCSSVWLLWDGVFPSKPQLEILIILGITILILILSENYLCS
jgi:hypothetical protein